MSFYRKYELQRLAHEGEAKVFRATQNATGRQVFLHVFPVNEATRDLVAEVARRLSAGPAQDLLESGEFAGAIYVVTAPEEPMFNLRSYLHANPHGSTPTKTAVPLPVPPAPQPVQAAPPPPPPPPPPVHAAPPPPPVYSAPPTPPPAYGPPPVAAQTPPPYTPPPQAPPPQPPPVFQPPAPPPFASTSPQAPPQQAPPPQAPPPSPFPPQTPPRSSVQSHPTAHGQEAVTQPVEPRRRRRTTEIISHGTVTIGQGPAQPQQGPGEFTRLFSDQSLVQQPAAPEPFPPAPPAPFAPPPPPPYPQQAPPPPPQPAAEGPGEFTRLFSSPGQPSSATPFTAPPPAAPPPPPAAPFGAPPSSAGSPFGAPPPQAGTPFTPPAPQTASPFGAPPPQTTSPFAAPPPPQAAPPYGAPPPQTAAPFGAPPPPQAPPPPTARDREMAEFERLFGPPGGKPFPGEEPPQRPVVSESPLPSWPQGTHQPPTQQPYSPRPSSQQPYPPPPSYSSPVGQPDRAGEFTQFFGSGFTAEPVDVEREQQRATAEPGSPSRKPFQQASEFTRMFGPGAQGIGDAPPPPPSPRTNSGWADQSGAYTMFGSKLNTPPPQMNRPIGEMTQHAGPSEYTRMISGGGSAAPGAGLNQDSSALKSGPMPAVKQVPGQQPGAAPSKTGQIGIILAISGILIALIVALVLLLTSK